MIPKEPWEFLQTGSRDVELPEKPSTWDSSYTGTADPKSGSDGILTILDETMQKFSRMEADELRNFCEVMRSLGYPRLISMENFRTPNFQLVAHCLDWLVHRYDPSVNIPDDIDTEDQRVEFIKRIVEVVAVKTRLRLNSKKLYSANVFAVRELLKLAMLLRDAQVASTKLPPDVDTDMDQSITTKLHDLPKTRALCSEIIESGAMLYDLLRKEPEMRSGRKSALNFLDGMSRNLET